MFDVTNKLSFESLDYWLQEFTSNGGKQAIMAVVANKVSINLKTITFCLSDCFCIQLLDNKLKNH